MAERGIARDHSTVHRWVLHFSPMLLGSVDDFEPVSCGGNMNHADETLGELVVSGGNGAVDSQSAEHPFD